MPEEIVDLRFRADGSLDEIGARLDALADRMVERIKQGGASTASATGVGGGTPGGSGSGVGAAGSAPGGAVAGAAGQVGAALLSGAAGAMGNLTPAEVSSPALVARKAAEGAISSGITAAGSVAGTALGAALGSVVPGVGTAIGAAAGSAIGGYASSRFAALQARVHDPEDTTAARLANYAGTLESHGIHVSDEFLKSQATYGIKLEQRRYQAALHAERLTKEVGVQMTGLGLSISSLGR